MYSEEIRLSLITIPHHLNNPSWQKFVLVVNYSKGLPIHPRQQQRFCSVAVAKGNLPRGREGRRQGWQKAQLFSVHFQEGRAVESLACFRGTSAVRSHPLFARSRWSSGICSPLWGNNSKVNRMIPIHWQWCMSPTLSYQNVSTSIGYFRRANVTYHQKFSGLTTLV